MIIDTHCHLNTEELSGELDALIDRAKAHDVKKCLCIGMYKQANEQAIDIANTYSEVYATVGLHPSYVNEVYDESLLITQAKHPKVVAIGEIGIDLYWVKDNLDLQIEVFKKQLDLSVKLNLPVVIHLRQSAQEIYDVLKTYQGLKGVMHCFSEDIIWARKFMDLGFYIGIGGPVTYKKNLVTKTLVTEMPLDRLLVETDSPYLAPSPFRGSRNEPAYTKYVVEEIARLRGLTTEAIADITTENANRLFNFGGLK
ncbi:MAG: hydrolase TatD [Tenericutes bacterium HGW-Tenericutes-8]|nr:MAG: hydrolase TatD [Tenericutes bacterium HGW-Tenericutes-8]